MNWIKDIKIFLFLLVFILSYVVIEINSTKTQVTRENHISRTNNLFNSLGLKKHVNQRNTVTKQSYFKRLGFFRNLSFHSKPIGSKVIQNFRLASQWYYLEIKAWSSSLFDRACMKATRPDNYPPKEKHISYIKNSVNSALLTSEMDPIFSILQKIWYRANYIDRRTGIKAFYVLHRLFLSIHSNEFRETFQQMITNITCPLTQSQYFNQSAFHLLPQVLSPEYHEFLVNYSKYVTFRGVRFGPSFEEFLIDPKPVDTESMDSYLSQLEDLIISAQECMTLLLHCNMNPNDSSNAIISDVTLPCIESIARDLEELSPLLECKLIDYVTLIDQFHLTDERDRIHDNLILEQNNSKINGIENENNNISSSSSSSTRQYRLDPEKTRQIMEKYGTLNGDVNKWIQYHSSILQQFGYHSPVVNFFD